MGTVKNLMARTFGKLTVIQYAGVTDHVAHWLCSCTCGGTRISTTRNLTAGRNTTCGKCPPPNSKPPGEAAFNDLYRRYKYDAKGKRREFTIPKGEFRKLVVSSCYYCGAEPYKSTKYKEAYNGQFIYNGLDRINNKRGYVMDNVVACCERCNKAKRGMTVKAFLAWVYRVHAHNEENAR